MSDSKNNKSPCGARVNAKSIKHPVIKKKKHPLCL